MKTQFLSLSITAALSGLLFGCTGGSGSPDADVSSADDSGIVDSGIVDSGAPIDAAVPDAFSVPDAFTGAACNPVTQAGCQAGEKCAQLVASDDPFLASTACVPDGFVTAGGACTRGDAGANGYDDCVAGYDCLRGICAEICTTAGGDTCRTPQEGFGEGSYCTLFANLFSAEIGLCVPGCDPADDSATAGVVTNTSCGAGRGCYLNITRGVAACAGVPAAAVNVTQDDDCYGPAFGSCYLNGCASGYSPILPDGLMANTNTCARYCTPSDTHSNNTGVAAGVSDKCSSQSLIDAGGAAAGAHQCRFIQSFYSAATVPASVGMCVPTVPWTDCTAFDYDGILAAVTGASDPQAEFDLFCLGTTTPAPQAQLLARCVGMGRGCVSSATLQTLLDLLP